VLIMHTFALSPESVRKYLRRTLVRFQVFVTISFLLFGLYLAWFSGPIYWPAAITIMLLVALTYFLVIFYHYRQQVRQLYSIRFELDGSGIIYRERGADPLRISRADILRAKERKDGLWIESVDPRFDLLVPSGLSRNGDEVVRTMVQRWLPIEPLREPVGGRHRRLRYLIYLAAFIVLLYANSLWTILPLGAAVFVYGVTVETRLARAYQHIPGMQRMYSMAFSFLFFIIMMKSCFLLMVTYLAR
jgi:hypothetical protein